MAHLHHAARLLQTYEGKDWYQVIPDGEFPQLLKFSPQKEYVRKVLKKTVCNTALLEDPAVPVSELPRDAAFFSYQATVNTKPETVPSHAVIEAEIAAAGQDYRFEEKTHPIEELRSRTADNTTLAR